MYKIPSDTYPIGYKFTLSRGRKNPLECEVVDHLTTTNSCGEVVAFRYVTQHKFMGQTISDSHVHTTLKMNDPKFKV